METALKRISRKGFEEQAGVLNLILLLYMNPDMNGLLIISLIKISQICGFTKVSLTTLKVFLWNIIMERSWF
jgi:hypothetical protein